MKSRLKKLAGALALLLLGAAVPVTLIWNPGHWSWADALTSRLRSGSKAPPAQNQPATTSASNPTQRKIKYWRSSMNHKRPASTVLT